VNEDEQRFSQQFVLEKLHLMMVKRSAVCSRKIALNDGKKMP
jgi:hypothetical protein